LANLSEKINQGLCFIWIRNSSQFLATKQWEGKNFCWL
jgi:hypothetical protein